MKTVSNVFSIIGMVVNTIYCIAQIYLYGYAIIFIPLMALSIAFAIIGIASTEKSIGLGIAMIFFVSPLAGIFYLCWDGK